MRIDCYMSLQCGTEDDLRNNIADALSLEKAEAEVNFIRIDQAKAEELGLRGSPAIFIDSSEIQPVSGAGFS